VAASAARSFAPLRMTRREVWASAAFPSPRSTRSAGGRGRAGRRRTGP
jgi:hypothetical protein